MGFRALIVDDSMLVRHSVLRWLTQRGFAVQAASNALEALSLLETAAPDVLIVGFDMPGPGGGRLITEIRKRPDLREVALVVVCTQQSAAQAALTGADYTVCKDTDFQRSLDCAVSAALAMSPHSRA